MKVLDNIMWFSIGFVSATIILLFLMVIPFVKSHKKENRMVSMELLHSHREQAEKDEERKSKYEKEQSKRVDQF